MRKKKKEFALVNARREFARKGGKFVTTEVASGRPLTLPKGFDNWRDGWSWHEVYETLADPKHTGKPIYELRESQTARVTKIIEPRKSH